MSWSKEKMFISRQNTAALIRCKVKGVKTTGGQHTDRPSEAGESQADWWG